MPVIMPNLYWPPVAFNGHNPEKCPSGVDPWVKSFHLVPQTYSYIGRNLLDMVWHETAMFGNDQTIQFTFGHPDELCRHVSELYPIIPPIVIKWGLNQT